MTTKPIRLPSDLDGFEAVFDGDCNDCALHPDLPDAVAGACLKSACIKSQRPEIRYVHFIRITSPAATTITEEQK